MSTNQNNTVISFQSTVDFQSWLTENFARADVANALKAFYSLSKISGEKKAAAYVATQMSRGINPSDLMQYAAYRTASV